MKDAPSACFRRGRRALLALTLAVIVGAFLLMVAASVWMVSAASGRIYFRAEDVPARPVGIVLGTGPGTPEMAARLNAAAALYKDGKVRCLLVSGGSNLDEGRYDEAVVMCAGLVHRGVPRAAITQDNKGWRTLDSIARARQVYGLTQVVIISQNLHLPRSLFLADHWGLDAVGFAAREPKPIWSESHLRELLARVLAVADVILHRQAHELGPPAPITVPAAPDPRPAKSS
jgi:vancomycin permeability regulator SanA